MYHLRQIVPQTTEISFGFKTRGIIAQSPHFVKICNHYFRYTNTTKGPPQKQWSFVSILAIEEFGHDEIVDILRLFFKQAGKAVRLARIRRLQLQLH